MLDVWLRLETAGPFFGGVDNGRMPAAFAGGDQPCS